MKRVLGVVLGLFLMAGCSKKDPDEEGKEELRRMAQEKVEADNSLR